MEAAVDFMAVEAGEDFTAVEEGSTEAVEHIAEALVDSTGAEAGTAVA